jgi:hypothetical protein
LILTQFCKKLNIPFDVYAFSSRRIVGTYDQDDREWDKPQYKEEGQKEVMRPHEFSLLHFLSSDMTKNEYKDAVNDLWFLSDSCYHSSPRELDMGCTPLNESIVSAYQMIPAFQEKHDVQIVNAVFLSDGDGHSMGANPRHSYYSDNKDKTIVHDSKTRKDYEVRGDTACGSQAETATYLQILKDRIGCNVIGVKLYPSRGIQNLKYRYFEKTNDVLDEKAIKESSSSWKKNNFFAVEGFGYDKLFIVQGNLGVETDALEGLDDDVSYVKLKNAFMKGTNKSKSSRVIATQMVDIIAQ